MKIVIFKNPSFSLFFFQKRGTKRGKKEGFLGHVQN